MRGERHDPTEKVGTHGGFGRPRSGIPDDLAPVRVNLECPGVIECDTQSFV